MLLILSCIMTTGDRASQNTVLFLCLSLGSCPTIVDVYLLANKINLVKGFDLV